MNVISPTNEVHLNVNLGGASVQVAGDMEHLDDLVHEVVEKLRPTLGVTDATTYSFLVAHSPSKKGSLRLPAPSGSRDADRASEALETPRESVDAGPPHVDSGPTLMPTVGVLSSVEDSAVDRVRIAVNIVGEPIDQGQSGFYGIGVAAQQSIIKYLQERLHLAAVPTRLVGLVSGLEALSYSLMFRAHYTLMARFDALTITGGTPAGYAMLSLTGRVHIVLLRDGKQLLDRSLMIPVTPFGPAEPPNRVAVRAITATMETIASDLRERLAGAH